MQLLAQIKNTATLEQQRSKPDKIALVTVTIFCESGDADGVMLTELRLHGLDNYMGMNRKVLQAANPVLAGNFEIRLSPGTQYQLVLTFNLDKTFYGPDTWAHLEDYPFFLRITSYPTKKDISLQ